MTETTPAPIRIRPALPTDAAEIARLAAELGYPASPEEMMTRLSALLLRPEHFIGVATLDDAHLLGWIAAEHRLPLEYGERVELVGLVVDSAARRGGVGKALVAAAEQWAAGRGQSTIYVRSNATRTESHPFYESLGYTRQKTQHFYIKHL
jgi:GNAT superfamily N-acetyltransferase